jgi:hypothetical protein
MFLCGLWSAFILLYGRLPLVVSEAPSPASASHYPQDSERVYTEGLGTVVGPFRAVRLWPTVKHAKRASRGKKRSLNLKSPGRGDRRDSGSREPKRSGVSFAHYRGSIEPKEFHPHGSSALPTSPWATILQPCRAFRTGAPDLWVMGSGLGRGSHPGLRFA